MQSLLVSLFLASSLVFAICGFIFLFGGGIRELREGYLSRRQSVCATGMALSTPGILSIVLTISDPNTITLLVSCFFLFWLCMIGFVIFAVVKARKE